MVITTDTDTYDVPTNAHGCKTSGAGSTYGSIKMLADMTADMRFQFVEAGTYKPVVLDHVIFNWFDIDQTGDRRLCFYGVAPAPANVYAVSNDTHLRFNESHPECTAGGPGLYVEPGSVDSTRVDETTTLSIAYYDVSEFKVRLELVGGAGGKTFWFGHESPFCNVVTPPTPPPPPSSPPSPPPPPPASPRRIGSRFTC